MIRLFRKGYIVYKSANPFDGINNTMRTISLDTETTGGSPRNGDRVVEIGLVEMIDGQRTGNDWQTYLNPNHKVHWGALRVHGLTNDFLSDKPFFKDIAGEMMDFIDGAPCKAHNARFDRDAVINEFAVTGMEIPKVAFYDTISMAKQLLSGPKFKLDVLVERLGVDAPERKLHGALLDAEILAMVVEKLEQMQPGFVDHYINSHQNLPFIPDFLKQTGRQSQVNRKLPTGSLPDWVTNMGVTLFDHANEDTSGLNPGVAQKVAAINATVGDLGQEELKLFRTGGKDIWSDTPIKEAAAVAVKAFGKDRIKASLIDAQGKQIDMSIRWMCRGVDPERMSAFIKVINGEEIRAKQGRMPDNPVQVDEDLPGLS